MRYRALLTGALVALCATGTAASPLPDALEEWRLASEDVTPLKTASEDLGRWTRRVYVRQAPKGYLEVNLMEGTGPGPLRADKNAGAEADSSAVQSADTDCTVLEAAGRKAVLERHPLLPLSLTVAVSPDATLTLESHSTNADELTHLATIAISELESKQ